MRLTTWRALSIRPHDAAAAATEDSDGVDMISKAKRARDILSDPAKRRRYFAMAGSTGFHHSSTSHLSLSRVCH